MLNTRIDALQLLRKLGASERLIMHAELVGEAADLLIETYKALGLEFNETLIGLGSALHDAGKIKYPEELDHSGSMHEFAGRSLLLANGVSPDIAECCVSHARWHEPDVSFEELSVSLADKLWKGKRIESLELRVIADIATRLALDPWDIFIRLDSVFERIAADGAIRLARSRDSCR